GGATTNSAASKGLTLGEAFRTPTFHIVWIGMFSIAMLVTVCHLFQVAIFASHQLSAYVATAAFAVSAVTMVACMPLVGRMLDRFPTRYVFAAGMLITAASLVAATLVRDLPTAVIYALIFGSNNAFSMTLFGYMWPRYFGRLHLGSVQGAGQTIGVVGASLGAPAVGYAHDWLGGYEAPLQMMAIYPAVWAVVVIFTLRTPRQLDENHPLD
ncbi:MAG: MFS transporter, partial [Rhodospirillaceae bacterium]|nr:MFS transporter [Rhodospirillaceae bacterium]